MLLSNNSPDFGQWPEVTKFNKMYCFAEKPKNLHRVARKNYASGIGIQLAKTKHLAKYHNNPPYQQSPENVRIKIRHALSR